MTYFTDKELACRCGCGKGVTANLLALLNQLREEYGKAIYVVSGRRCQGHNARIGGAPASLHLQGLAVDLAKTPELLEFLKARMETHKFCIEDPDATPSWIHIDRMNRNGWRIFKP